MVIKITIELLLGYLYVSTGFFIGKVYNFNRSFLLAILAKVIIPLLILDVITNSKDLAVMNVTLVVFLLSTITALLINRIFANSNCEISSKILAYSSGTGNCGYALLPIADLIFDNETFKIYLMSVIGIILFEFAVGNNYILRTSEETKYSRAIKLLNTPTIVSFFSGIILNIMNISIDENIEKILEYFKELLPILGMLSLGLDLSSISNMRINRSFLAKILASKFIIYPLVINLFIGIDQIFLNFLNPICYDALNLLSFAPLSSGMFRISGQLGKGSEAGFALLLSMILVIFYLPLMISLLITGDQLF